jgi:hypothetical protein
MGVLKRLGLAVALAAVPVVAAAQQSAVDRAYAECRRQLAGVEEGPGTGNPIREQAIQACAQQKLRQQQSPQQKK